LVSDREKNLTSGRVSAIDGLRGVSILLVLCSHLQGPVTARVSYYFSGWYGVDIFFVISGFLITSLLLQERDATGSISLRNFYFRRFARIFPVYYVYLATVYAAGLGSGKDVVISSLYLTNYWMGLGYAGGETRPGFEYLDHLWSLAVEEQFYLLWPPILVLVGRGGMRVGAILIASVWFWKAALILIGEPWTRIHWPLDTRLDCLMIGCVAAFIWSDGGEVLRHRSPGTTATALLIALFFGLQALGNPFVSQLGVVRLLVILVRMPLASIVVAWLILCLLASPRCLASRVLSQPALVWVGRQSYSLYVWHMVAFSLCRALFGTGPITGLALDAYSLEVFKLTSAILMAAGSYYLIEMPFLRLKRRWERPRVSTWEASEPVGGTADNSENVFSVTAEKDPA
jgi:peptidoglycan/LPS O-acetylase OafA/YrhL